MKNNIIKWYVLLLLIGVSCQTEQEKIKLKVDSFGVFADSLLAYNKYYVEVLYGDTEMLEIQDPINPALNFKGKAIQLHSNIFDTTTNYDNTAMANALQKYNGLMRELDSVKFNMDQKTAGKFEAIKANINQIKKPIK